VLVFAAVSNNFPGEPHVAATSAINLILGGWAMFNLSATLALLVHRLPGPRTQLAILAMDLAVASALVYLTGFMVLIVLVILISIRDVANLIGG